MLQSCPFPNASHDYNSHRSKEPLLQMGLLCPFPKPSLLHEQPFLHDGHFHHSSHRLNLPMTYGQRYGKYPCIVIRLSIDTLYFWSHNRFGKHAKRATKFPVPCPLHERPSGTQSPVVNPSGVQIAKYTNASPKHPKARACIKGVSIRKYDRRIQSVSTFSSFPFQISLRTHVRWKDDLFIIGS